VPNPAIRGTFHHILKHFRVTKMSMTLCTDCYRSVERVLRRCYEIFKRVSRLLQECCMSVTKVLHECYTYSLHSWWAPFNHSCNPCNTWQHYCNTIAIQITLVVGSGLLVVRVLFDLGYKILPAVRKNTCTCTPCLHLAGHICTRTHTHVYAHTYAHVHAHTDNHTCTY
jgi:hypothetical protein